VLQPVLVRPAGRNRFELVLGERRYRASQLAGLAKIPARVLTMTDAEVLTAQLVENEQRKDISPIEKADGYARLIDEHGLNVEQIADRIGKSRTVVRDLLKLRSLPDDARQAVAAGTLTLSVAVVVARIPGEKARSSRAPPAGCRRTAT
jgi:ParB family chromosome partitioning protein